MNVYTLRVSSKYSLYLLRLKHRQNVEYAFV